MFKRKNLQRVATAVLCLAPMLAVAADWDQTLVEYGRNIRIGLYAIGGSIALGTIVWSGIQWMLSRANGDHSHGFMDYLKQVGVIMVVGGSVVLATAAWQVFGTGSPA